MARQRNNISRLALNVRARIAELLDDGATYDEIRSDEVVSAALAESGGLALHSSTFGAYRESAEYQEFCRARRRFGDDIERRRMAAYVVDSDKSADDLARIANYELLRIVLQKLEDGEALEPKELRSVSGALAAYERNRISEAKEDARRDADERESQYRSRIADLENRIQELTAAANDGKEKGITKETLKKIEEQLGLM